MTAFRLASALALTLACLAAPALAQPRGVGLPMDSERLPPNSAPGDCVVRRVTGPGGAYRWDRVECDHAERGWSDHDQWGYGNRRLDIETRQDPRGYDRAYGYQDGDRYGARRHTAYDQYEYEQARAYDGGYDQGRGGPVASYPPSYAYGYVAAGRDEAGYLIWPGKTP